MRRGLPASKEKNNVAFRMVWSNKHIKNSKEGKNIQNQWHGPLRPLPSDESQGVDAEFTVFNTETEVGHVFCGFSSDFLRQFLLTMISLSLFPFFRAARW